MVDAGKALLAFVRSEDGDGVGRDGVARFNEAFGEVITVTPDGQYIFSVADANDTSQFHFDITLLPEVFGEETLVGINVGGCAGMRGSLDLVAGCKNLRELNVQGCTHLQGNVEVWCTWVSCVRCSARCCGRKTLVTSRLRIPT